MNNEGVTFSSVEFDLFGAEMQADKTQLQSFARFKILLLWQPKPKQFPNIENQKSISAGHIILRKKMSATSAFCQKTTVTSS